MAKTIKPKRVGKKVIIPCRLSYVHLDAPWSSCAEHQKKYSVSCIIPKDDKETLEAVNAAIEEALTEGKSKNWGGIVPKKLKMPMQDGDERDDQAYSNAHYISASNKNAVPTLNRLQESIPPSDFYSGCYAAVSITFFPYSTGSKGVGAGLNAVLFLEHGDKLGGDGGNAKADFDGIDLGVDDSLNDM